MLARTAQNLYWQSRYLERVECIARLVLAHGSQLMDSPRLDSAKAWMSLVRISGTEEQYHSLYAAPGKSSVITFLLCDPENGNSITQLLQDTRDNLRSCRDCLGVMGYEAVNNLVLESRDYLQRKPTVTENQVFLRTTVRQCMAITGTIDSCMRRDLNYWAMRTGCLLERVDMTLRILAVHTEELLPVEPRTKTEDSLQWVSVLRSVLAHTEFLREKRTAVNARDVTAFLLQDSALPRSCRFCLDGLEDCLQRLADGQRSKHLPLRQLRHLRHRVVNRDITELHREQQGLYEFFQQLQADLLVLADAIEAEISHPATQNLNQRAG